MLAPPCDTPMLYIGVSPWLRVAAITPFDGGALSAALTVKETRAAFAPPPMITLNLRHHEYPAQGLEASMKAV